ncbi:MAG: beta-CASP ribonuclease aCPSF1 [Candidatus Micrarchaeota archaeon]
MNNLNEIQKTLDDIVPRECGVTKIEFEGPDVVIYLKNLRAFYSDDNLIRKIAVAIRKRVLIRSDPSSLMPADQALKKIKELVPVEAGVTEVKFSPEFCEVIVEALKPGLVIGKGGGTLREVITTTGWALKILRTPTMPSDTIKGIRASLYKEAENRKKFLNSLGKKICGASAKSDWVKVTALGGFKEVGRTCILVQTPNDKILIDCGINAETNEPSKSFPYLNAMNLALDELDAVIVTHAHLDHSGFIPYLYAYGYDGPVYCTPPTRDTMVLLQFDYLDILNKSGIPTPYMDKDIRKMLNRCVTREYEEVTDITPETKLTLHNAGHILGSAMVHLHINEGLHNFVYTGDIKYGFTRLFEPANTTFPRIETLFMESTYGGREDIMPQRQEIEQRLAELIKQTIANKGKVLIPVFAVGRSQEIMLVLEEYAQNGDGKTRFDCPIYLDGMILEASAIHTAYPEYLRQNVQRRVLSNNSPFESKIFESVKNNRKDIAEGDPCVILAPSGMLSGGPSVEYLKMLADDPKNLLLFVGYQSALSLGRKLQKGMKEIPLLGESGRLDTLKINMRVETVEGFSGHSDRYQLINFAKNIRPNPEQIFTLHGDESKCDDLARSLNKLMRLETRAPMNLDTIRLK